MRPRPTPRRSAIPSAGTSHQQVPWLVSAGLMVWWLLSFIDSAYPQAQMALLGGRVLLPAWLLDAVFLLLVTTMLMRRGWPQVPTSLVVAWAIFSSCLMVSLVFLEARFDGVAGDLIVTFYRAYFYTLVLPFAMVLSGAIAPRTIETVLIILALPLAALGIYQHLQNDPVLPTISVDRAWQVYAWRLEGSIRAFSLFNSGWSFGHYFIFIALLSIFLAIKQRIAALVAVVLVGLCAFCAYVSFTRTVYLVGTAALVTAFFFMRARHTGRYGIVVAMPFAWGAAGYLFASGIKTFLGWLNVGGGGIYSSNSLDIRQESWDYWTGVWFSDLATALFGSAVTQKNSGHLWGESTVLIDNVYISIGVQLGLMGLLIWMGMVFVTWLFLIREARRRDDALSWAIVSAWATLPLSLTFGAGGGYYGLLALLSVMTRPVSPSPKPAPIQHGSWRRLQSPAYREAAHPAQARQAQP